MLLKPSERKTKVGRRKRRHIRIRKKVFGTAERPRILARKTLKHLYLVAIDDRSLEAGAKTVASVDTTSLVEKGKDQGFRNIGNAKKLGGELAAKLKEKGIESAVFDRGGYRYHGIVQALADGIREGGVKI
ncbi:MAG: 50S ribosomal protein L18 [Sumerlaeia bacterium]